MKSGRNKTQQQTTSGRPSALQRRRTSKRRRPGESNLLRQYQLRVTPANDAYESEADRMARQVTQMTEGQVQRIVAGQETDLAGQITPLVQRQEAAEEEEEAVQAKKIQRQEAVEEEEEAVQAKAIQRQEAVEEEEEAVQAKAIQRQEGAEEEEEEAVQAKTVQRQEAVEEEEEAVQAKAIQRQEGAEEEEEEEAVQAKTVQRQEAVEEEEEEPLQAAGKGGPVTPEMEERINQLTQGGGRPLDKEIREYFEPRFGADFSQIRIHDDAEASQIAGQMNARAFTQGQHIFFGQGQYQPQTSAGRELLGHELTHTIQQGAVSAGGGAVQSTVQRQVIQRVDTPEAGSPPASSSGTSTTDQAPVGSTRVFNSDNRPTGPHENEKIPNIHADSLSIPAFKHGFHESKYNTAKDSKRLYHNLKYSSRNRPNQSSDWDSEMSSDGTLNAMTAADLRPDAYYLIRPKAGTQTAANRTNEAFGKPDMIAPRLLRPNWDDQGNYKTHDVDHIVELQVSGWPDDKWANEMGSNKNVEMLDSSSNSSSGNAISQAVQTAVSSFKTNYADELPEADRGLNAAGLIAKYHIYFDSVADGGGVAADSVSRWIWDDIAQGKHVETLKNTPRNNRNIEVLDFSNPNPEPGSMLSPHNLSDESISGSEGLFVVYYRPGSFRRAYYKFEPALQEGAGQSRDVTMSANQHTNGRPERWQIWGFEVSSVTFNPGQSMVGQLTGEPFKQRRADRQIIHADPITVSVNLLPGNIEEGKPIRFAGFIPDTEWSRIRLSISKLSPIRLSNIYLDDEKGLTAGGNILPTVPFLERANIEIVLEGNEVRLQKTFDAGELALPGPVQITQSNLTVFVGTETGLGISGRADFTIDRVGQGYLGAEASTGTPGGAEADFALQGGFNFDTELFNPAQIEMWYRQRQFGARGTLGIPSGRVRGIQSAQFTVGYENETITASGTAQFAAPGIQQGNLNLTYSQEEGLIIGGSLQLRQVPGLSGGSLEARVQQKPDGTYKVSASGTAQPNISGVTSQVSVSYEDGLFDANVTASYQRGILAGQLTLGATNRPVDEGSNRPTGEPTDQVRAYGGGQVTAQIAPWLQGTVGIRLLPNGEIELAGEIALPNTVEIFPRKAIEKNIFTLNIDIPIVGVAVAGQRIGIFATVGGGLDASAGIGPGQIQELSLGVQYNPDREDETHVYGRGRLHIPADAGLRLFVRGGLGVGIPIVSATAGLEVSGQLGIEGAIGADVNIDWRPRTGLEITANANIFAEPTLRLSVDAYVEVTADLLLTEIDLYSNRWNLAGVEYGSGLRFGINFPIHYQEGQPFDISLDDVQFTVPDIDARSVISNVL